MGIIIRLAEEGNLYKMMSEEQKDFLDSISEYGEVVYSE